MNAVRELSLKWSATVVKLIEDKAHGSAVVRMLSLEIQGILPANQESGKVAGASGSVRFAMPSAGISCLCRTENRR